VVRVDAEPVAAPPPVAVELPMRVGRLGLALGFAFVGGLLLNLMPCVLPVLSLKVLGFVSHGRASARSAWHHGLAFTVGVLVFFWLLAGTLLALRAGGEQIGWGFQLQSPGFVVFLAGLFLLLSLNLFGVFEVGSSLTTLGGVGRSGAGLGYSFWSGALATLVATPCTAPFMGSALGYALAQPAWAALLVFTALGLGMAAPYLLLSRFTGLARFVPKPGPWMETFKQLMGFILMGTVVALAWLLGRQVGADGMAWLLGGLLLVGLGAWTYGRSTSPGAEPRRRLLGSAVAAILVVAGLALALDEAQATPAPDRTEASAGDPWEPFSSQRLAALRAAGTPVFLDFTADWCLTCQVNEQVAFGSGAVFERFRRAGVVAMRADWTRQDAAITRALAGFGRQGVPLYVLYGPDAGRSPRILPEIINEGLVLKALEQELGSSDFVTN
jgi:thiol:disulfide interchange protein DsbD